MSSNSENPERQVVGFLGLAFDHEDGHRRLTTSEHFVLLGGSAETHERMQDTAIRFADHLRRRGKTLAETPLAEVIEIFHDSHQ